jgi:hypothetical protein
MNKKYFSDQEISEFRRSTGLTSERELWGAVLSQAIEDLSKPTKVPVQAIRHWFLSPNQQVGSFIWICGQLEIETDAARKRILRASDSKLRAPRPCESISSPHPESHAQSDPPNLARQVSAAIMVPA